MTSSADTAHAEGAPGASIAPQETMPPLPPALSSMWRLCKLGYRHEPRLMLASFVLSQLAALPDALLALWLKLLGQGVDFTLVFLFGEKRRANDLKSRRRKRLEHLCRGANEDVLALPRRDTTDETDPWSCR